MLNEANLFAAGGWEVGSFYFNSPINLKKKG